MTMSIPEAPKSGLTIIERPLDNTAMSAYMTCPREYDLGMRQHRRRGGTSEALDYGSLWHLILEVHYKTGGNAKMAEMAARARGITHGNKSDHRSLERCLQDYRGYRKKWGETPGAESAKTVGYPHAPLVEISADTQCGDLIHPYAVKIDRIIEDHGLFYVEDHKTTSRLDKHFFKQFATSNQMKGYVYVANHLFPGIKIAGVRINVNHILKDGSNFERHIETYSPDILQEWVENTNSWMRRIAMDTEANHFPGHFGTNGCDRKFGLCQYHNVCGSPPRIRAKVLESEFVVNPWNPLELQDEGISE